MTTLVDGPAVVTEPLPPQDPAPLDSEPPAPPPVLEHPVPPGSWRRASGYLGAVLSIVAALALGCGVQVGLLGQIRYQHAQQLAYADFRADLANATAPTGPNDADGHPLAIGAAVAVLRIPALHLRAVVFEGTTSGVLENGPGHRRDTVLPGQAGTSVIFGRRAGYGSPFAHLDLLNSGDVITVVTGQGEHTYRVLGVRRSGDLAPPVLPAGAGRLTLVTADGQPFLPDNLIRVEADLTSQVQPTPRRLVSPQALPADERALAGDPDAWLAAVLWTGGLTVAVFGLTTLRRFWGRWQCWLVAVPVFGALGVTAVDQYARLLPNLL